MPPQTYRHSLEHTLDFIRDLDRARNVEDIASKVLQYLSQIRGRTPRCFSDAEAGHRTGVSSWDMLLLSQWPDEWARRYAARHYVA